MTAHRFWTLTCDGCGEIWDYGTPQDLADCKRMARLSGWTTGHLKTSPDFCTHCAPKEIPWISPTPPP